MQEVNRDGIQQFYTHERIVDRPTQYREANYGYFVPMVIIEKQVIALVDSEA